MEAIDMRCPYCGTNKVEACGGQGGDSEQFTEKVTCSICDRTFTAEYTLTAIYKQEEL